MGLRVAQVCGLWFWVAFAFFVFVLFNHSSSFLPISSPAASPQAAHQSSHKSKQLSTADRVARSEASWSSSVALRHKMALAQPSNPQIPLFPAQTLDDFGKFPFTVWDFFPATWTCPHDIQRVGRLGDGGKWVCGMSLYEEKPAPPSVRKGEKQDPTQQTIIYSFGVNDESTFEDEMLARIPSASIFAYDYSVSSFGPQLSPSYASRAHFRKVGLGAADQAAKTPPFFTLQTLMKQNNHTYIDILKIDIEGSEYTALDSFMDACDKMGEGMPIGQIMIELHLVDDGNVDFQRFTGWWERLEAFGMRPTWLEINLLAVTLGKGKTDPRCVEYVLVNARDKKSILLEH